MSEQDQEPVMIPVTPRFDPDGRPTCDGCPMNVENANEWCVIIQDHIYSGIPKRDCPIHSEEARAGMEPL